MTDDMQGAQTLQTGAIISDFKDVLCMCHLLRPWTAPWPDQNPAPLMMCAPGGFTWHPSLWLCRKSSIQEFQSQP